MTRKKKPPVGQDKRPVPAQGGGKPPIVGLGASAGGLSAFQRLFQHLPTDTGMGYVVVQHMDPHHESMLPSLLARATGMPVHAVEDGMAVEADKVYVMPPNTSMTLRDGLLRLAERSGEADRHLPVDVFFTALAKDQGPRAVGVILSGTASDGTQGMKAIKAEGGITFADSEAEFEGMPRSAIDAGYVDFALPVERIAEELVKLTRHLAESEGDLALLQAEAPRAEEDDLARVFRLLRARTGNDFSLYKRTTIRRRIRRRMVVNKLEGLADYVRLLQQEPTEVDRLFRDMLISVTAFFRDPEVYSAMARGLFPQMVEQCPQGGAVRIWVPGCATGEEAYSLAIALLEHLGERSEDVPIQIFATDIDEAAIEKARAGIYTDNIRKDVSPERLRRFFVKVPGGFQISKAVRDLCVFAVQNATKDPPFSRLSLVCCRNLLIYLSSHLQERLLRVFHYALRPEGFLVLGTSESVGNAADLFSLVDKRHKFYAKKAVTAHLPSDFANAPPMQEERYLPTPVLHAVVPTGLSLQHVADREVLERYGPPGVVVNHDLQIVQFRGKTGPFLDPTPGVASFNLLKMARQDLVAELRGMLAQALRHGEPITRNGVAMRHNGEEWQVDLSVLPLTGLEGPERFFLVLFGCREQPPLRPPPEQRPAHGVVEGGTGNEQDERIRSLDRELAQTREYMQSVIEDQEATNEELKAANEEIQSTNEELQSTNEELETAKEELQSTNEELATVNEELEVRNAALTRANDDLVNVLASVDLAIVMLGADLRIRHFTPVAQRLLNLIDSDAGRRISDINPNVEMPDLARLVPEVLDTMTPRILEVKDQEGRWYSLRIRPYKTMDNRIEGVVLAVIDISEVKHAERLRQSLAEQEKRLAAVVRDSNDAVMVCELDGRISAWNRGAEAFYGYPEGAALGMDVHTLEGPGCEPFASLAGRLKRGEEVRGVEAERVTRSGKTLRVRLTASLLKDEAGSPAAVALTERDAGGAEGA
jgi:two-component system CheB/CheR fusion protein